LLFLDPFDTGRLTLLNQPGPAEGGGQIQNVSRGRNQEFDSAVFGNSHIENIDIRELGAATGFHFVTMVARATAPKQQLLLMRYFLDQHPSPRVLVLGLDITWCMDSLIEPAPFPYWLYEESTLAYVRGMFRMTSLNRVPDRIRFLSGLRAPLSPDGGDAADKWDDIFRESGKDRPEVVHQKLTSITGEVVPSYNRSGKFAAAPELALFLERVPAATKLVLVWPPIFVTALPVPNSKAADLFRSCQETLAAIGRKRHTTAVVDWVVDRPENRDENNFFDPSHGRRRLGQLVEKDIVAALVGYPTN
jgi:hypothetical protein